MDELLRAIEQLKQAYKESKGVTGIEITLGDGVDMVKLFCNEKASPAIEKGFVDIKGSGATVIPHKQTNGEWLRGLSDEEFVTHCEINGELYQHICDKNGGVAYCSRSCFECELEWLRAEHKE